MVIDKVEGLGTLPYCSLELSTLKLLTQLSGSITNSDANILQSSCYRGSTPAFANPAPPAHHSLGLPQKASSVLLVDLHGHHAFPYQGLRLCFEAKGSTKSQGTQTKQPSWAQNICACKHRQTDRPTWTARERDREREEKEGREREPFWAQLLCN